jgi:hypothetical protein
MGEHASPCDRVDSPIVGKVKGVRMAKVKPYHTNSDEYPRDVYHDYDNCPDGERILRKHREEGTDDRPRCKECVDLD